MPLLGCSSMPRFRLLVSSLSVLYTTRSSPSVRNRANRLYSVSSAGIKCTSPAKGSSVTGNAWVSMIPKTPAPEYPQLVNRVKPLPVTPGIPASAVLDPHFFFPVPAACMGSGHYRNTVRRIHAPRARRVLFFHTSKSFHPPLLFLSCPLPPPLNQPLYPLLRMGEAAARTHRLSQGLFLL